MAKKISWKTFFTAVGTIILVIAALIGAIDIIQDWLNRAKPQILAAENCSVRASLNADTVRFELLVNNAGKKDCSIVSINLMWPDGLNADVGYEPSTPLPKNIPAGLSERIIVYGFAYKFIDAFRTERRVKSPPEQNTVEGTVFVKFNNNKIIQKTITFSFYR